MTSLSDEQYLELIGDWKDPNPTPVIEEYNGIKVVRDDMLGFGSKIRFVDYFIINVASNSAPNIIGSRWVCSTSHKHTLRSMQQQT
jgi:hypothetical protein